MLNKDYYILLSMIETVDKIIRFTQNYNSAEAFYASERDFDATLMNFIVLGEAVEKLTDAFKEKHDLIDWHRIYGMRNIVAHNYFGVNADIVWQAVQKHIPVLRVSLSQIAEV